MERICFTMLIADDRREKYVSMHAEPWPELVTELDRTGWQNYSLFLRDDGVLVGYHEAEDWPRTQSDMAAAEVSPRWSHEMDQLVVPGTTMRYPRLAQHLESPRGDVRHCFVLDSPVELDVEEIAAAGVRNASVFIREDGMTVLYAETMGAGIPAPLAELTADTAPLVEIFNLAQQLERLPN